MATEATFEPFDFYDGDEIVGIDVEIAGAIAEKLGMTLEVTDIAFDSIVPSVQAGKYDIGMAGMTVTDERLEQVNFTDSYAQGVQVVIVNEDSPITSIDDLFAEGANNLVGTQSGTTGFLYATWDIADARLGEVKNYAKTTDAATALLNKQIDCNLLDSEPDKAIVAYNAGLKLLDSEYSIEDYAIAISKDNAELTEMVNGALNELIADGTVKNILDKYIGLLMSDQSPIEVKVAAYDDKMNFKIKKTFNGSLLKIIEDVQDIAERMNDTSAIIDTNSWKRIETKSYPGKSLREIILNAFCHANYFIRSNIKVEFFKDRAKITSPGGLFKSSIEDMLKGVQTYRNQKLVHILDKMNYIENFGTGIPRTLEAYEKSDRQPEFYNSENFFIVYLPNLNYKEESPNKSPNKINKKISDLGLAILSLISNNPGIKVPEIFEIISRTDSNINIDKIRYSIKTELKEMIELKGSKKIGGYYI